MARATIGKTGMQNGKKENEDNDNNDEQCLTGSTSVWTNARHTNRIESASSATLRIGQSVNAHFHLMLSIFLQSFKFQFIYTVFIITNKSNNSSK
jgi:hypothetical protein